MLKSDEQVIASLVRQCTKEGSLQRGRALHAHVTRLGNSRFLQNLFIQMYGSCRLPHEARAVFNAMNESRNVYSWTIMIQAYTQNGHLHQAMHLYRLMCLDAACLPNNVTFVNILLACVKLSQVRMIHSHMDQTSDAVNFPSQSDVNAANSLVCAYGRLGSVLEAKNVFDGIPVVARDVVSWNSLLAAYARNGDNETALRLFYGVMDVQPDEITFVTLVEACGQRGSLADAKTMHHHVALHGFQFHHIPIANGLISMYSSCSSISDGLRVFEAARSIGVANVVTWTAMLSALAIGGHGREALNLLNEMITEVAPNSVTLTAALEACNGEPALVDGEWIHGLAHRYKLLDHDLMLNNALLSMYCRCGGANSATELFDKMQHRSVVTWAAMIGVHARKGNIEAALDIFHRAAQEAGNNFVDDVTFVSLLTACSHSGKLDKGLCLIWIMTGDFGILPHRQHYACIVDLLARAGRLVDARELLQTMPFYPDIVAWTNFFSACGSHVEFAEEAANQISLLVHLL